MVSINLLILDIRRTTYKHAPTLKIPEREPHAIKSKIQKIVWPAHYENIQHS